MNRSSAASLAVGRWLAVSLLTTALACATAETNLQPPDPANDLPPGVSKNPAEFRQHVSAFALSGNVHRRGRPGRCPTCLINISIEAVGDTRLIDPRNGPAQGRAVAHILNLDPTDTEAYYGIQPSSQAEYYLWVDRNPVSGRARWTLLRVPMGAGSVTAGRPRDLRLCRMSEPGEIKTSDADFAENRHPNGCDASLDGDDMKASQASLVPHRIEALLGHVTAYLFPPTRIGGGWIDCIRGCCT
jgi:hypothetical protein